MTDLSTPFHGTTNLRVEPVFQDDRIYTPKKDNLPLASRAQRYFVRPMQIALPSVFAVFIVAALYFGWLNRNEGYLTPELGTGYWLGIGGSIMMLLLLLYPLRKRLKFFRSAGRVSIWFRLHMFLGVAGPLLVVFHSNFQLGSLNSSVALFAMLIVAGSGLIGRYLYAKIHMGLYGRRAEIREIVADAEAFKRAIGVDAAREDRLAAALKEHEAHILPGTTGFLSNLLGALTIGSKTRRIRREMMKEIKRVVRQQAKDHGWSWRERRLRARAGQEHLAVYLLAVRKAVLLSFYERLFAGWHVLHLPLFFLLILAAITHVIAVHLY